MEAWRYVRTGRSVDSSPNFSEMQLALDDGDFVA